MLLLPALILAVPMAIAGACSAGNDNDDSGDTEGAGLSGAGTGGGLITTGSAQGGNGASCAGTEYTADELPLDMYIMLDQSGSMADAVQGGDTWTAVTGAIGTFVNSPGATGIGVGIQYFPKSTGQMCPTQCFTNNDCGVCGPCFAPVPNFPGICMNAGGDSCMVADYATPEVPIALLPGAAQSIVNSMAGHGPSGGTPISAALDGAIQYAKSYAMSTPNHVVIAVLATDGDPTSCDTNLANIEAIAANGVNGFPSILTFVIGVGASLTSLDGIAQAGGTGSALIVDTTQNVNQQFLDALNQIKGAALGCVYAIPAPTMGDPDYGSVNVVYTPGGATDGTIIPKVSSASACPPNGDGWYYDDNQNPTQIILCDATCAKISGDDMAKISIELGCATVVE
jgi:hypothetical protein